MEYFGKVAGIGGLGLGSCFLLYLAFLQTFKSKFPKVTQIHAFELARLFLFLSFGIAVLGMLCWVFVISHGPSNQDQGDSELLRLGDRAIAAQQFNSAITYYQQALQQNRRSWLAYYGLGQAYYGENKYDAALDNFRNAFGLQTSKDGEVLRSIAVCQEALLHFEDALNSYRESEQYLTKPALLESVFDEGRLQLTAALAAPPPEAGEKIKQALSSFLSFKEQNGDAPLWLNYHLACITAFEAKTDAGSRPLDTLANGIMELRHMDTSAANYQKNLLKQLFDEGESIPVEKGGPVRCPPLMKLVKASPSVLSLNEHD